MFWSSQRYIHFSVWPEELIKQLGIEYEGQNIDCNPEHNFFALHPGTSFKTNKGKSLKFLDQFGHKIYMIGNSMSDGVNPNEGVQCAFVQGSRITSDADNSAMYVSPKPLMQGVNDILEKIGRRMPFM